MKLIELEAAVDVACNAVEHYPSEWEEIEAEMRKLPVVEERKHGHWNEINPPDEQNNFIQCSVCGSKFGLYHKDNYCQNCGAKMDEEAKND